jgi:peptidoglycan/xylan/chitin deacetylase (PgdA/CDA1 family)
MSRARAVPVLMYHHVSPNPGLVTVTPRNFELQMQALAQKAYTTLSADQFAGFLRGRNDAPERSVLITFDDGYLDNYVHAFPVLRRLGLHALVFAVTGRIGEGAARPHAGAGASAALPDCPNHRRCAEAIAGGRADEVMLRWSEIELMQASGCIETHSHTHTHQRWDRMFADRGERLAALDEDLRRSRATLQRRLGGACAHLCWPWGYSEPQYQAIASALGFDNQYTVAQGLNRAGDDPARIRRLPAKDRPGGWLASRLWIYRQPRLGGLYLKLRGS